MSYEPEEMSGGGRRSAAAGRTNLPGLFLIIVGVFNLLWSLYLAFSGFQARKVDLNEAMGQMDQNPAQKEQLKKMEKQLQEMEQMGMDPQKFIKGFSTGWMVAGLLGALFAVVTILGGVKMRGLNSYGLAMTGSVLALIPCTSVCCVAGIPFGLWAMIVLLNQDVKSAFR